MTVENEELRLDLNELCIQNPATTFFVRVRGKSMEYANIRPGDLLIVDRSIEPGKSSVIVAIFNGQFAIKQFVKEYKGRVYLQNGNSDIPIVLNITDTGFEVWGVAVAQVRLLRPEVRNG